MRKKITSISLGIVALSATWLGAAEQPANKQTDMLKAYGWVVGAQSGLNQLGLSKDEIKSVMAGVESAASGEKSPVNLQDINTDLQQFLQTRAMAFQEKRQQELDMQAQENKKAAEPFFANLDKDKKIKKSKTGLYYEIQKMGDAHNKPKADSIVKIDYEGTLSTGEVFDSSKKRGEPATFSLERVIPGFQEGLQYVGKGGKIKLYIPADLAYGNQDIPGIPPGSTLVFDVDMLEVMPAEENKGA